MIKYCNNCDQKLIMGFNFCPVCGKELEIISDFDVKNEIKPYLRDTSFYISGRKNNFYLSSPYDKGYRKDCLKVIKRFIENKPDSLTISFGYINIDDEGVYGSLELRLNEKDMYFQGSLIFNINKTNLGLAERLLDKEEMSRLFREMGFYKEKLIEKHNTIKKGLRQLNKLEDELKEEE